MKVEILHIDECANWREAGRRVRAVLDGMGRVDVDVTYLLLRDSAEASAVPFAGSPTILLDGHDAFPPDERTSELACRIYFTGTRFEPLPSREQLEAVFRQRAT